jgi:hypothetical protein
MALFTDNVMNQILEIVSRQHRALGVGLGVEPDQTQAKDSGGPLRVQLQLLIQVANGELSRANASKETQSMVERALSALLEAVWSNALRIPVPLPDAFWQTEIGVLVSRVRWWLSADDLITISNAAALAFGANTQATRMRIIRAIEGGLLESIPDPSVANPQHNRRVLRSQVERLREQRRLPT